MVRIACPECETDGLRRYRDGDGPHTPESCCLCNGAGYLLAQEFIGRKEPASIPAEVRNSVIFTIRVEGADVRTTRPEVGVRPYSEFAALAEPFGPPITVARLVQDLRAAERARWRR